MHKNNTVVLSIFKGVLSLSIIALVCTVLLGAMNIVTYIDPLQSAYDNFAKFSTDKQYTKMLEENWQGNNAKVLYYAQSTDGTTNAFLAEGKGGYGGPVEVYVIVDVATKVVKKIELGNHSETFIPNLLKANYFDQYLDKDITQISGSDIDAVAGATMSSTAVANAIIAISDYYAANPTKVEDQTQVTSGGAITKANIEQVSIDSSLVQMTVLYSGKDFLQQDIENINTMQMQSMQLAVENRQGGAF